MRYPVTVLTVLALVAGIISLQVVSEADAQSGRRGSATRGGSSQGSATRGGSSQGSATRGSGAGRQGSGARGTGRRTRQAAGSFEGRFWQYLTASTFSYDEWAPFAGRTDELYKGQSPHGAYVRVIANKLARRNPSQLPHGSILIKENYGADGKKLMAITVMYRTLGANGQPWDAENRDWYYVKYLPDGRVASSPPEMGSKRLAGRVQSCIDCHSGASGRDYVFLNDDQEQ